MIERRPPQLPWVGVVVACPVCGVAFELEASDAKAVPPVTPKLIAGKWTESRLCPYCRVMRTFVQDEHWGGVTVVEEGAAA